MRVGIDILKIANHIICFTLDSPAACNCDTTASAVLNHFTEAVSKWGLSSRVRGDMGVENSKVAQYMLSHPRRNLNSGIYLTGKSVHNTRIERLWRDGYNVMLSLLYELFVSLEGKVFGSRLGETRFLLALSVRK
ncbi:hypothetical protein CHS0354_025526 [Potamilus streckersoni]|uniref:Integrase core domain-containing protein n=1 Tax=Potamilus streckersoni TaxID=2493646 RepID=A0AAE0SLA6_9BIVA|nr:hypothetical protein CHS0354_025526 [Potamilus streckersoni]